MKKFIKEVWRKISPTYKALLRVENKLSRMEEQHRDLVYRLDYYYSHLSEQNKKAEALRMNTFWLLNPTANNIKDVQRRFWDSFPQADGDMAVIQSCNLWLMKEFKNICEKNGLYFWLHGGTLIGAIRHHGFIPWDDDVDIGMLRSDLEKLISITENSQFKIFVYYHDDETFSRGYQFKLANEDLPVFIDIFVFDYCSCENVQQMADMQTLYDEARTHMVKEFLSLPTPIRASDIGYKRFGPFNDSASLIAENIIRDHMALLGEYYQGNCLYYGLDNYPFPYKIMEKDSIFPLQGILFEGDRFNIPNNHDIYLEAYNDFWQMPKDFGEESPHAYWYKPHIGKMKDFLSDTVEKGK